MSDPELAAGAPPPKTPGRTLPVQVLRWLSGLALAIVAFILVAVAFLHTSPGRQFIVDQITKWAPASGMSVRVDEIDGSVLWSATFRNVRFFDADGVLFLQVPEIDLDWRPYKFLFTGLDVRYLVLHDGTLFAAPRLLPGDPDAPILPNFDIRVDHFILDDLRIAEGLIDGERIVNFRASTRIEDGAVRFQTRGELGGGDRLSAFLVVEPDGNTFDIDVDYRAPEGGLLSELTGAEEDLRVRVVGDGTWKEWDGALLVTQNGSRRAAFKLYERSGLYRMVGQIHPGRYLTGLPAEAAGEVVSVAATGTLENSVLAGGISIRGRGISADAGGAIDLGNNAFDDFSINARLLDPSLFGEDVELDDLTIRAVIDGGFRNLRVPHELRIARANISGTALTGFAQQGTATFDGERWTLPLNAALQRISTGNATVDPRLVNGRLRGTLIYAGGRLLSDDLAIAFPGLRGNLVLRADLDRGDYTLSGPVEVSGLQVENVGILDGKAGIRFHIGPRAPWTLQANVDGRLSRVTNATLANLAGQPMRFSGAVTLGADQPVVLDNFRANSDRLTLAVDARYERGEITIEGTGRHVEYGRFTIEAEVGEGGPRAVLVFENPLPAAGLRDVRVALSPTEDGFRIETEGQSTLGPFEGAILLHAPQGGATSISVERMEVSDTSITGDIVLEDAGVTGNLYLAGGGINGTVTLAPRDDGQGFDVNLVASRARFGGATPLAIRQARVIVSGVFGENGITAEGNVRARGIRYGTFVVRQLIGTGQFRDGHGTFEAALAGQRGSRFELQIQGDASPERIAVAARGNYAGQAITMPRRAVLSRTDDGGWELQRTQISFAGGDLVAEGRFGGDGPTRGKVALADMPLSLINIFSEDVGLGGTVSGVVDFQMESDVPVGRARVLVDDLTRTGLVLSSEPIDIALVAELSTTLLQTRAMIEGAGEIKGRLQGRIAGLPASGPLMERLKAGDLFAQLRYGGPAGALWRLLALDVLDVTGTIEVAADVRGTLTAPLVRGSLSGDDLRVESSLTGTSIRAVRARGTFSGSRLRLTSFAGTAPNGGSVTGSGTVDLSDLGRGRGPRLDVRMAAQRAKILDRPGMEATVTGPLRIVSDGNGGTIAGRLTVNQAHWQLGGASAAVELPNIMTREINAPDDNGVQVAPGAPWRYLINAVANDNVKVDGMGLDSEWSADIILRGTTEDPRIGGQAQIIPRQGFYTFAGTRFDITRGRIAFDENVPIDPRIDIAAETQVNGLGVTVTVTGRATRPDIDFSSSPPLPDEEILARLLFGGSITDLTATDALQLGAALASLRGGEGGLDPINELREAVGLDRLRIVPADPALDRETAIALGKNFGRRFFMEVITDGRGYNATSVEFRMTSWLSLLATVSSIGRESVAAAYTRDY